MQRYEVFAKFPTYHIFKFDFPDFPFLLYLLTMIVYQSLHGALFYFTQPDTCFHGGFFQDGLVVESDGADEVHGVACVVVLFHITPDESFESVQDQLV